MKRSIVILLGLSLLTVAVKAQETPPAHLVPVNGKFFMNPLDSSIWHDKGFPYGMERLARYKDISGAFTGDKTFNGAIISTGNAGSPLTINGGYIFSHDDTISLSTSIGLATLGNININIAGVPVFRFHGTNDGIGIERLTDHKYSLFRGDLIPASDISLLPVTFSFATDGTATAFNIAYTSAFTPTMVDLMPSTAIGATGWYITNITTSGFTINYVTAPPSGTAAGSYTLIK